ncbi:MAG TPA: hypothetical protein VD969_06940 [Symbiobacteriaceae bacterium]|nr:hypothetical protein [Symbiobacteriaceae bacterium]
MPRWARFLSCSFTGLVLSLFEFFVAAYLFEGNAVFWQSAIDFAGMPAFWYLAGLFGLLVLHGLVLARALVRLAGLADGVAGLLSGAGVALFYAIFLVASHARDWGGWAAAASKAWPAGAVFALPLALSGAFTSWLWHRLD